MTREIVVVTAASGSLPGLTAALRAIPVTTDEQPLLRFAEPEDWTPVDRALDRAGEYRAAAVTSPRASSAIVQRIRSRRIAWPQGTGAPVVWAGGPATAAALEGALGPVRIPLDEASADLGAATALARAMLDAGTGSPVLFPCGDARREELARELTAGGLEVDQVVCYRSILASEVEALAAATRASVLLVTSPRVAELLARACPDRRPDLVAVGPTTARSALDRGWPPAAIASAPTTEAVVVAVQSALAHRCV